LTPLSERVALVTISSDATPAVGGLAGTGAIAALAVATVASAIASIAVAVSFALALAGLVVSTAATSAGAVAITALAGFVATSGVWLINGGATASFIVLCGIVLQCTVLVATIATSAPSPPATSSFLAIGIRRSITLLA
jgi:hypothetical protein